MKYINFFVLAFFAFTQLAIAQGEKDWEETSGELEDARLLIEKETVLELPKASRNFDKMSKVDKERANPPQEYQLQLLDYYLGSITPEFDAMQLDPPPPSDIQGNYIKAGFGNFITPYFEGYVGSERSDEYQYSARLRHLSSQNGPVDSNNSGSSFNDINAKGKYFLTSGAVSARANFERRMVRFYGYNPLTAIPVPEAEDIQQVYNTIDLGGGYEYFDDYTDFTFSADLDFYRLTDSFNASETNLALKLKGDYQLNDESKIFLDVDGIINEYSDAISFDRNLVLSSAGFRYNDGLLDVTAGFNLAYNADTTFTDAKFRLFPNIIGKYTLIEDQLTAIASLTGNIEQQTLRGFMQQNPFLNQNILIANTDRKFAVEAGIESNPIGKLGVNAKVGYASVANLPFFVNDDTDQSKFDILYEREAIGVLTGALEASIEFYGFRGLLQTNFYGYNVQNLEEPWHRPNLTNKLSLGYQFNRRLFLDAEFYHFGGIRAREPGTGETVNLDNIIDLNLKADYVFMDNLSGFLAVNNIISQEYQRYLYYPVRGINILAGVTYTFSFLGY